MKRDRRNSLCMISAIQTAPSCRPSRLHWPPSLPVVDVRTPRPTPPGRSRHAPASSRWQGPASANSVLPVGYRRSKLKDTAHRRTQRQHPCIRVQIGVVQFPLPSKIVGQCSPMVYIRSQFTDTAHRRTRIQHPGISI